MIHKKAVNRYIGLPLKNLLKIKCYALLVIVMTIGCEDKNNNLSLMNLINKPVLLRNSPTPLPGPISF